MGADPLAERDYSHRSLLDKLGIKDGQSVWVEDVAGILDARLIGEIRTRAPHEPAEDEPLDLAIVSVDSGSDIGGRLRAFRARLKPAGGIWLVTPKRGLPGYIRGDDLIPIGIVERLVDNKICSVSDRLSAMRFVIRRQDRTTSPPS